MRFLNLCVLALLVIAAAYVYEIKFESTLRAERVAKMRGDVQRERDAIAALRAEWTTLENPARIQGLARRHLHLRPAEATQYNALDRLPERQPVIVQPPPVDAIADKIDLQFNPTTRTEPDTVTGSVPTATGQR
jgi:cell division protein FtsL